MGHRRGFEAHFSTLLFLLVITPTSILQLTESTSTPEPTTTLEQTTLAPTTTMDSTTTPEPTSTLDLTTKDSTTTPAPQYLYNLSESRPGLRSNCKDKLLSVPRSRNTSTDKAFIIAGTKLWNTIPSSMKSKDYINHAGNT
ncbi:uncharacterized protein LOC110984826 [Acanthaster planci]|uniref:Uncharacterized protein LOC110984826 n=1 Tax=Acanthaster planci TaxID=133434 RepID=A0A8B7ZCZ7_ACAPL|nr:uncharacterized protein LOC110984826 [Acanthaster planci]